MTNLVITSPGPGVQVTEAGVRVARVAEGAAGNPGASVLHGVGAPDNGFGADNDFYIDTSAVVIYGPKVAGAWPTGVPITGPQGDPGVDGNDGATVHTVSGAPSNTLGANLDYAVDPTALIFYGPKASGVWPAGSPLTSGPTPQIRVAIGVAAYTIRQADAPGGRDVVYLCEGATVFHVLPDATEPLIAGCVFGFLDLGGLQPSIVFDGAVDVVSQNGNKTSGAGSPMTLTRLDVPDTYVISGDTTT